MDKKLVFAPVWETQAPWEISKKSCGIYHDKNTFGAKIQAFYPLLKCRSSSAAAGGESPSMADMSSNNGEESPQSPQKQTRAKKGGGKRKSRRNLLTPPNQGYSSGAEQSQSAFPIPTPDRLGTHSQDVIWRDKNCLFFPC